MRYEELIQKEPTPLEEKEQARQALERDKDFKKILEATAFRTLKLKDADKFFKEYTGERDDDGYLIRRDGRHPNMLPSQALPPKFYEEVWQLAETEWDLKMAAVDESIANFKSHGALNNIAAKEAYDKFRAEHQEE